VCHTFIKNRSP